VFDRPVPVDGPDIAFGKLFFEFNERCQTYVRRAAMGLSEVHK
jgi:hypothetical protein